MVLGAMQYFLDKRLESPGDHTQFLRLENLGHAAAELYDKPDAGLWEYRNREAVHTFSAAMCWAACDRLGRIARHLGDDERAQHWEQMAETMHARIAEEAWNESLGSFAGSFGGSELDASLLMLHELGFVEACDALLRSNREICDRLFRDLRGTLATGHLADIAIYDYVPPTPLTGDTLYGHLLFGLSYARVLTTIARGEVVVVDGRLVHLDEVEIRARCRERAPAIWQRVSA